LAFSKLIFISSHYKSAEGMQHGCVVVACLGLGRLQRDDSAVGKVLRQIEVLQQPSAFLVAHLSLATETPAEEEAQECFRLYKDLPSKAEEV
jgi:hypothetical protein